MSSPAAAAALTESAVAALALTAAQNFAATAVVVVATDAPARDIPDATAAAAGLDAVASAPFAADGTLGALTGTPLVGLALLRAASARS